MRFIFSALAVLTIGLGVLTACTDSAETGKVEPLKAGNQAANQTLGTTNLNSAVTNAAPKVDEHGHMDNAPRITLAEAKKDFDAGNAVFIDTRSKEAFETEHIKGAINVPVADLEAKLSEIPKDKKLIVYCS